MRSVHLLLFCDSDGRVTNADVEYPGRFIVRAHTVGHPGGAYLPGALVADTLNEP